MTDTIIVKPAPELRAEFARWGLMYQPHFRTVSPNEFAVPAAAFTEAPEELLDGAVVDGHPYQAIPVGERDAGQPAPTVGDSSDEERPSDDTGEQWRCDDCGRGFATQRGLTKHRNSTHAPEES